MDRVQGIVKTWNAQRAFGFIEVGEFPYDYDLFFHITSCGEYQPDKGDIVTLIKIYDKERGKYKAVEVIPTGSSVNRDYFDGRVSRRKLEEARKNVIRLDRGCTCEIDLANCEDRFDLPYGRCWYCNETKD